MTTTGRFPFADEENLGTVDDATLRKEHARVMQRVFDSNGIERMVLGVGLLSPVEGEMRRRGIQADYWSTEHRLRSDLALVERQRRACDAIRRPDHAAELDRHIQQITVELRSLDQHPGLHEA